MTEKTSPEHVIGSSTRRADRSSSDEERLMAILQEARRAPLPSASSIDRPFATDRSEGQREEKRRLQVQWLAQLIQRAPTQLLRERSLRRRWFVGVAAFAAAAAALFFIGGSKDPSAGGPSAGGPSDVGPSALGRDATVDPAVPSLAVAPSLAAPMLAAAPDAVKLDQVLGKVVATRADGRDEVLSAGMLLSSGDRVSTTAEAFASLALEAGIRVDLASATTVAVLSNQEIDLRVGRVDVNVPKLPGVARRLSVNTPDTKVVVRGTIFSVEFDAADMSAHTRVGVTRGAVSVFHNGKESRVDAGQLWNSTKPGERESLLEEELPKAPVANAARAPQGAVRKRRTAEPAEPAVEPTAAETESASSSLSRQNAIFERGLRARDQGDAQRASYWFDQLLRRYPTSPLAESAERERAAARARLRAD